MNASFTVFHWNGDFLWKLCARDSDSLYKFEHENRDFFEKMVPTRGDDYYVPEEFMKRHESLLKEQEKGDSYFYLIKDKGRSILGRINLVDINKQQRKGHLGYRVGKDYIGMGVAKRALAMLLEHMKDLEVHQIHAKTTANNIASQQVLVKNGFTYKGTSAEMFEMNGENLKFVFYEWNSKGFVG
ncbi:GNAT family N-acetyltransferase [Virgibacillus siamensis]|uniref:GNAT family N-acetyltransferase n=1 Tax=Virgibacillus siamensis TaxID=480071 RepID=A0ABP3R5B9_9BACI